MLLLLSLFLLMSMSSSLSLLALHGKDTTGPQFLNRLQPFTATIPKLSLAFPTSPHGPQWWILPDGVRSRTALEYPGYEESRLAVLQHIKDTKPTSLLGQSQGAIMLFSLLIHGDLKDYTGTIILNGIQNPKPFESLIASLTASPTTLSRSKILLLVGSNDSIAPPAGAYECRDILHIVCGKENVTVLDHTGGHSVPIEDEEAARVMRDFITAA